MLGDELTGVCVSGASDDIVSLSGEIDDEISCYGTDDRDHGVLLVFSDGTILEVKYGKNDAGIWGVTAHRKGVLFDRIDECLEDGPDGYSDKAFLKPGVTSVYAAKEWERIK